jgi:hypothetical protein
MGWLEPLKMLHLDTKKLGHIERPCHRITGNRCNAAKG